MSQYKLLYGETAGQHLCTQVLPHKCRKRKSVEMLKHRKRWSTGSVYVQEAFTYTKRKTHKKRISTEKASEQGKYKYRKRIKQVRSDGVANELEHKSSYSYSNFSDTPLRATLSPYDTWIPGYNERSSAQDAQETHKYRESFRTGNL